MYEKQLTNKGYDLFEVASALQKSIRRCDLDNAMYWAVELYNSNFGEYCWKRLVIIASEDIGLAEPDMPTQIEALYQQYQRQAKRTKSTKDKNAPERLFLTHAVLRLCEAKKSRLVDWCLIYYFGTYENTKRQVPEWAQDKHTQRGRSAKRGWKHFFEEGTLLERHNPHPHESDFREKCWEILRGKEDDDVPSLFS